MPREALSAGSSSYASVHIVFVGNSLSHTHTHTHGRSGRTHYKPVMPLVVVVVVHDL